MGNLEKAMKVYAERSLAKGDKTIQAIQLLLDGVSAREVSKELDISLGRVYTIKNTYL